jgi:alpha-tubulin suppressor-like RCC1 family protein
VFKPKTGGSAFADSDSEKIFFTANAGVGGAQMWVTDGQDTSRAFEQTHNAIDIDAVATNSDYPAQLAVYSDTLYFSAGSDKFGSQADVKGTRTAGDLITVSVSVAHGSITLGRVGALSFSVGSGWQDTTVEFTGTLSNLNAALAFAIYKPALNWNSEYSQEMDILVITASDNTLTSSKTLHVRVLPQNDAPVLDIPGAHYDSIHTVQDDLSLAIIDVSTMNVKEDELTPIKGVTVRDVDAHEQDGIENLIEVALYTSHGKLSINAAASVQAYLAGNGKADRVIVFHASVKTANLALEGLSYQGDPNYHGEDEIIITVDDLGNSGYLNRAEIDGTAEEVRSLADSQTIPVVVHPVNDLPVWGLPAQPVVALEDVILPLSGISVTDVDIREECMQQEEAVPATRIQPRAAAGYNHTIVLREDGSVSTVGAAEYGQLGQNSTLDAHSLASISVTGSVHEIAAGAFHSVLVMGDGTVQVFGSGKDGQLGLGVDDCFADVKEGRTVTSCIDGCKAFATLEEAMVHCRSVKGCGGVGKRLQDGLLSLPFEVRATAPLETANREAFYSRLSHCHREVPTLIKGLSNVIEATAGDSHTILVLVDGTVFTFGDGAHGQLGHGDYTSLRKPKRIAGQTDVRHAAAGGRHSVLLFGDGTVKTFGDDTVGQLGQGPNRLIHEDGYSHSVGMGTNLSVPTKINQTDVLQVAAGDAHTVLLVKSCLATYPISGTVIGNEYVRVKDHDRPHDVYTKTGQCSNIVKTFGHGLYGQLGHHSTQNVNTATPVDGLIGVKAVAAGAQHTVALMQHCYSGPHIGKRIPNCVEGCRAFVTLDDAIDRCDSIPNCDGITLRSNKSDTPNVYAEVFELRRGAEINDASQPDQHNLLPFDPAYYAAEVSWVRQGSCKGMIRTFGRGQLGQLGHGNTVNLNAPATVENENLRAQHTTSVWGIQGLNGIQSLGVGRYHTVLVMNDGSVMTFGDGDGGQLGQGPLGRGPLREDSMLSVPTTVMSADGQRAWRWKVSTAGYLADHMSQLDTRTLSHPDDCHVSHQVTISAMHGSISMSSSVGVNVTVGDKLKANAVMTFEGTLNDINRAVASLMYSPYKDWNSDGDTLEMIVLTIKDFDALGTRAVEEVLQIHVQAVNDQPQIYLPGMHFRRVEPLDPRKSQATTEDGFILVNVETLVVEEDVALLIPGVKLEDVDLHAHSSTLQLTITSEHGTVELGGNLGLMFLSGTGKSDVSMTFKGSATNINMALSGLRYTPALDYSGADTIAFTASDLGNVGEGGELTQTRILPINVTAMNDAPAWQVQTSTLMVVEDGDTIVHGVAITDPDVADAEMELSVVVNHGYVAFTQAVDGVLHFVEGDGQRENRTVVRGSLGDLNLFLSDFSFIPGANWNANARERATITLTINDFGATGIGGPRSVTHTLEAWYASAVNDPPVVYVPGATRRTAPCEDSQRGGQFTDKNLGADALHMRCGRIISVASIQVQEDTAMRIHDIYIDDSDIDEIPGATMVVNVTSLHGTVTISSFVGLAFLSGDGKGDDAVSFEGTLANVNRALAELEYQVCTLVVVILVVGILRIDLIVLFLCRGMPIGMVKTS